MKKIIVLFGLLTAVSILNAQDYSFKIEVTGKGTPILMIPGLSSSGDVWDESVKMFKSEYECHVVTLPGFAGQPAIQNENYLATVGDELIKYLKKEKLRKPIIMGHSLGGFLALYIGSNEPKLASKLIIVDGLPYLGAARDAASTPESNKTMAENMRKSISAQTPEEFEANQPTFLKTMITSEEDMKTAMEWGRTSDRPTIAQALYELFQIDLREDVSKISAPTLVLGAWIAYKDYGVTKEMTLGSYKNQYSKLKDVRIEMSETGRHFIMWDDPDFFFSQVEGFLNEVK